MNTVFAVTIFSGRGLSSATAPNVQSNMARANRYFMGVRISRIKPCYRQSFRGTAPDMADIPKDFSWVRARAECSVAVVYERLRLQVHEDIEQRKELRTTSERERFNFSM